MRLRAARKRLQRGLLEGVGRAEVEVRWVDELWALVDEAWVEDEA